MVLDKINPSHQCTKWVIKKYFTSYTVEKIFETISRKYEPYVKIYSNLVKHGLEEFNNENKKPKYLFASKYLKIGYVNTSYPSFFAQQS